MIANGGWLPYLEPLTPSSASLPSTEIVSVAPLLCATPLHNHLVGRHSFVEPLGVLVEDEGIIQRTADECMPLDISGATDPGEAWRRIEAKAQEIWSGCQVRLHAMVEAKKKR